MESQLMKVITKALTNGMEVEFIPINILNERAFDVRVHDRTKDRSNSISYTWSKDYIKAVGTDDDRPYAEKVKELTYLLLDHRRKEIV